MSGTGRTGHGARILLGIGLFLFFGIDAHAEMLTLSGGLKILAEKSRMIRMSKSDEQIAEADSLMVRSRLLPAVHASGAWSALAHEPAVRIGSQAVPTGENSFISYTKQSEYNALTAQPNPDPKQTAQVSPEIARLQEELQTKAQASELTAPGSYASSSSGGWRRW